VQRLLEEMPELPPGAWLEPGAGRGAIIRAVREHYYQILGTAKEPIEWTAVEVDGQHASHLADALQGRGTVLIGDLLSEAVAKRVGRFAVVFGNPPFRKAQSFLEWCLPRANWVVLLLRVGFLESEDRNPLLRLCPPDLYVLPNRPSFRFHGTDATTYAWMVWPPNRMERKKGNVVVLPWRKAVRQGKKIR
jgi:hypothetical protein